MPLSDEQQESILKIMEGLWGAETLTQFERFKKIAEDRGVSGDDFYKGLVQGCAIAKSSKGLISEEEFRATMGTFPVAIVDMDAPTADPPKGKN